MIEYWKATNERHSKIKAKKNNKKQTKKKNYEKSYEHLHKNNTPSLTFNADGHDLKRRSNVRFADAVQGLPETPAWLHVEQVGGGIW